MIHPPRFLREGQSNAIYFYIEGVEGSQCKSKAEEFLEEIRSEQEFKSFWRKIKSIADNGPPINNTDMFKLLPGNAFEIRGYKLRLFGFFHDDSHHDLILTFGWKKGKLTEENRLIRETQYLCVGYRQDPPDLQPSDE